MAQNVKAVKILVDGLTFGSTVFAKGQVVIDPTEDILLAAEERRTTSDGVLMCKVLGKSDALKAARKADAGEVTAPLASLPPADDEEEVVVIGGDAPAPAVDDEDDDEDLGEEA